MFKKISKSLLLLSFLTIMSSINAMEKATEDTKNPTEALEDTKNATEAVLDLIKQYSKYFIAPDNSEATKKIRLECGRMIAWEFETGSHNFLIGLKSMLNSKLLVVTKSSPNNEKIIFLPNDYNLYMKYDDCIFRCSDKDNSHAYVVILDINAWYALKAKLSKIESLEDLLKQK